MVFKFVIFLNIKMSREAKKQNTNIIKKKKKKIQKTFCERYKSIFEEGNNKKQQYGREQY